MAREELGAQLQTMDLPGDAVSADDLTDAIAGELVVVRDQDPFLEGYLAHPDARARLLRHGEKVLDQVRKAARRLPEGGRALAISHLLTIELAAMMARGDENPAAIGAALEPLEGIAFDLDAEGGLLAVRALRLPPEVTALGRSDPAKATSTTP